MFINILVASSMVIMFTYTRQLLCDLLKLWGRYLLFKIIFGVFGGVIIVLDNKSIMMRSFTLLSVSVMI